MKLHLPQIVTALLAALTLTVSAGAAMAEDGPQLMLKLKPDDVENLELQVEDQLPKMGFYSQFIYGKGAYVTGVKHGSEAARLGLEDGDIIVGINGQKLMTPHTWSEILHDVVYSDFHEDEVLLYGAQQSGGKQNLLMKPKLNPINDQIVTLHIRDWRTGHIAIRKTNLMNWN